jgi:HD-GYP domain-containing protein (c-di-GMP phosphodiesterase class II)
MDQAFAELGQSSGTHFDPECVQAFVRLRPRIESIRAQENVWQANVDQLNSTFLSKDLLAHRPALANQPG